MENLSTISANGHFLKPNFKHLSVFILLLFLLPLIAFGQKDKKKERKEKQRKEVTVCHDGKTIKVKKKALKKHLRHGDTIGSCDDDSGESNKNKKEDDHRGDKNDDHNKGERNSNNADKNNDHKLKEKKKDKKEDHEDKEDRDDHGDNVNGNDHGDNEDGNDHGDNEDRDDHEDEEDKGDDKVVVCHEGSQIEINEHALEAHLNHGDIAGPCNETQDYTGTVTPVLNATGKVDEPIGAELTSLVESFASNGSAASGNIFVISENSKVLIEIVAQRGQKQAVISFLSTYGITEFNDGGLSDIIVTVLFPINNLPDLNLRSDIIRFVNPVYPAITNSGIVTSLGDAAQQSDNARNAFGLNGEGIKIAVLSDSYNLKGLADSDVNNGDLPGIGNQEGNTTPVTVVQDYPVTTIGSANSTSDEGRAMLQIIHDVAPKAELAFRTGIIRPGDMAAGVIALQAAGYDIIVDDITFFKEPYYQDGVVAQAVNQVTSQGVQYFTSAGNFGNNSYEAQFNPAGKNHDFFTNNNVVDVLQSVSMNVGFIRIVLQWDDDYYTLPGAINDGAQNDLDIYLISNTGDTLVNNNTNNLGGDPIEIMNFYVNGDFAGANIAIYRASGTDNVKFKYIVYEGKDFKFEEYATGSATITGHANAAGAMSVGAVLYTNTPAFGAVPTIASFSSRGGLAVNGSDRNKPDFIAPNGANTTVDLNGFDFDGDPFPNFFGTSASAPHAAGVAALLLQAKTKFGETFDLRQLLKQTAIDMETSGFDNASGSGFIQADAALLTFAAPIPTITELIVPAGADPRIAPIDLIIKGKNLHPTTKVLLDGVELPAGSTTINSSIQLTVTLPLIIGDPAIQASTSAISSTGVDGGISEPLYLFTAPKKKVKVIADNKVKRYGEMLPIFTATITVDGIPLDSTILTIEDLGLNYLNFSSVANSLTVVGNHVITPIDNTGIPENNLQTDTYDYEFVNGILTIEKTLLKITPNDLTKVYGEQLSGITYIFEYDSSNIDPDDNIVMLNNLMQSYSSTFVADEVIAIIDRGRGIVNRGRGIVNGSGWSITPTTLINRGRGIVNGGIFIDIPDSLLMGYELDSTNTITNRGRGIVNGGPFFSGEAWINRGRGIVNGDGSVTVDRGRGIVNDGALVNNDAGYVGFDDLIVIVDSTDYAVSSLFSINLVSGLEVTTEDSLEFIVPGGYFAQESINFEITYGLGNLRILPATLSVTVDDKAIMNGDQLPPFTATITGFAYEETSETVFSSITFEPTVYNGLGIYSIIPTFTFTDKVNYVFNPLSPEGVLTVDELGLLVSTDGGLKSIDDVGNVVDYISSNSRSVEVYNNKIYVLGTRQNIDEYDNQGVFLRSISIPTEVTFYLKFTVLPNTDFALYDNQNDKIYFVDSAGNYIGTVNILDLADNKLQNLDGVVVGNSLIFSENGKNQLLKVDLQTYQTSIFKDLTNLTGWLGAIDYRNGTYYICQSTNIWSFTEGSQTETLVSTLPEGNITSIVVTGDYAYVTVNFTNRVYKVNIVSGVSEIFAEGTLYPQDIEVFVLPTAAPPIVTADIWMLSNADPDYTNPPFDDYLLSYDNYNDLVLEQIGYNFAQSISGSRSISVSENGGYAWMSENVSRQLTKVSADGVELGIANTSELYGAIDIVSDGRVYALEGTGTTGGGSVFTLDQSGNLLDSAAYGGLDIVVDESNSIVWIVGASIHLLDMNLNYLLTIDPIAWSATSVDVDILGDAWIGEGRHPTAGGIERLIKVSRRGTIVATIPTLTGRPFTVRVNKTDGKVWYVNGTSLNYYDPFDESHVNVGAGGFSFDIDYYNGVIWTHRAGEILKYSFNGDLISIISNPNVIDQNYLGTRSFFGDYGQVVIPDFVTGSVLTQGEVSIYPNPVDVIMNIEHADDTVFPLVDQMQVEIYDGFGVIQSVPFIENGVNNRLEFNMTGLSPGIYFVYVTAKGVTNIFRIQKN